MIHDVEDDYCGPCAAPVCGDCNGCCCPATPCRCDEPHRGVFEEGVDEPLLPAPDGWEEPPLSGPGWGSNSSPQETA